MSTSILPAILIAGAPNCGKSVLSFLLTQRLRQVGVAHYLLRSAPDGEGDWFLTGDLDHVQAIRQEKKGVYSDSLVSHMQRAVAGRTLPLLVDVGGKPCGSQWSILAACTHSIVLYRDPQDCAAWRVRLAELGLQPLAELESDLGGSDRVDRVTPLIQGAVAGLERDPRVRREGPMLDVLVERLKEICGAASLESERLAKAPLPLLTERSLALALQVQRQGENFTWRPADLAGLPRLVSAGQAAAIDGRGPVWLAAALAAAAWPAPAALFDARLGWLALDPLPEAETPFAHCLLRPSHEADWVEIYLTHSVIEPSQAWAPPPAADRGVVLSGKLPRWYFARLARHCLAHRCPWVGVYVPQSIPPQVIIVHSRCPSPALGQALPAPPAV